jgi:hypothetical protein
MDNISSHIDHVAVASLRAERDWAIESLPTPWVKAHRAAVAVPNRRFKLINVEHTVNELAKGRTEFRLWPHLGLLYVGSTPGLVICPAKLPLPDLPNVSF